LSTNISNISHFKISLKFSCRRANGRPFRHQGKVHSSSRQPWDRVR